MGYILKQARLKMGYTRDQLSERVGISVKIAASEPVARRKRATHAGEVSHAISRKKLHGKI